MASFERLRSFLASHQEGIEEDARKGILTFPPSLIEEGGRILFETMSKGGFATFIVPGRGGWDPESGYYEAARGQARRGRRITRLFLLPHRHYLREPRLRKHWELDTAAGINVKFAILSEPSLGLPLLPESLDFGIWDEELVCWVYKQSKGRLNVAGDWVVTNRAVDLDLAHRIRDALLEQEVLRATPISALDEFVLEEPLVQSAPTTAMLSEFLCKGDHLDRQDCTWYHKAWQYLRLLDLVSTPTWHSGFYLDALTEGVRRGQKRSVFISGAADYSMLAYVLHASERIAAKWDVTMLDSCETPLLISRWYAARKDVPIKTVKEDILGFRPSDKFDCIVTDAFLTRFNNRERKRVLEMWKHLLKRTGNIVTTVRLDPSAKPNEVKKASVSEVEDFAHRAERLAELWRDFILLDPEEIGNLARGYAERMQSYPIRDIEELQNLFEEAGLRLEKCDEVLTKGEMKGTAYAEIIATIE